MLPASLYCAFFIATLDLSNTYLTHTSRTNILYEMEECLLLLKVNTNNQKRTRYDSCYLNVIQTSHKERLLQPVLNTKTANE